MDTARRQEVEMKPGMQRFSYALGGVGILLGLAFLSMGLSERDHNHPHPSAIWQVLYGLGTILFGISQFVPSNLYRLRVALALLGLIPLLAGVIVLIR